MNSIKRLFSLSLILYPRLFRDRFSEEMMEVFSLGLEDAKQKGELAGYFLREFLRFPANLLKVYVWSMQAKEGRQMAVSGAGGGSSHGVVIPEESWGASIMAGLPSLLMGIIIVLSEILAGTISGNSIMGILFGIGLVILVSGVVLYSHFKGWKNWSASWLVYIYGIGIAGLSALANSLPHTLIKNDALISELQIVLIPILLAYLLYKIACKDRSRGLLAAIPASAIIWILFLEFVYGTQKALAWSWIFFLAFLASFLILRTRKFSTALLLAIAVPILGGFPFVYLGVYWGGTLPFSQPGPSIGEVFKQYLPFLSVALTMIFGPQLAYKLRSLGQQYAEFGGKVFYRLALGGVLLGMFFSLLQWETFTSGANVQTSLSKALLIGAIVLFAAGLGMLLWTAYRHQPVPGDHSGVYELAALILPLIFVPVAILLVKPTLSGNYPESWLIPCIEIVWVAATGLVISK